MSDYIIDCSEVLGLTQRCDFWGETINYRNVQEYSAKARFRTKSGISKPLWNSLSGQKPYITGDYFAILVNGVDLGSGKVTSFSSEGGQDVSSRLFDVAFQILKTGDLGFMTGSLFTGLAQSYSIFPYLNNLSEKFEYSQENNKTINYSHSLDIDFERGLIDRLSGVSGLKTSVLNTLVDFGIYYPIQPNQYKSGNGIKRLSETFDEINGSYSYEEEYSYQSGLSYIWDYNHSLSFSQDGLTSMSEDGKITASQRTGEKIEFALSGWNSIQTGIFARLTTASSRWSGDIGFYPQFVNDPVEKKVTKNYYEGSVSYGYSYSSDLSNQSGFNWSYENSISLDQEGYTSVSEDGSLYSKKYDVGEMDFLLLKFKNVCSGVTGRANSLYDSTSLFFKNAVCVTGTTGLLVETNTDRTFVERPPKIDYSYQFSDDPSFFSNGEFKKVKRTVSNTSPVHIANTFNIINDAEIVQGSFQSTLGTLSNSIEIIGKKDTTISSYYNRAISEVLVPSGTYFISNENYTYDPFTYIFNFNRDYSYSKYRSLNDYQV